MGWVGFQITKFLRKNKKNHTQKWFSQKLEKVAKKKIRFFFFAKKKYFNFSTENFLKFL